LLLATSELDPVAELVLGDPSLLVDRPGAPGEGGFIGALLYGLPRGIA
jgi:hypothetical protein